MIRSAERQMNDFTVALRNDFLFFARRLAMTNALAPGGRGRRAGGRYRRFKRSPPSNGAAGGAGKPEECDGGTFNTLH